MNRTGAWATKNGRGKPHFFPVLEHGYAATSLCRVIIFGGSKTYLPINSENISKCSRCSKLLEQAHE